ncbi:MAG: hypothetical protein JSW73_02410 [Candidatus Woesearchaeota archaeon]|nr:MAG: hypothetical protein JSW73_02410 [Candidatus Woesearchaeota archaeon]
MKYILKPKKDDHGIANYSTVMGRGFLSKELREDKNVEVTNFNLENNVTATELKGSVPENILKKCSKWFNIYTELSPKDLKEVYDIYKASGEKDLLEIINKEYPDTMISILVGNLYDPNARILCNSTFSHEDASRMKEGIKIIDKNKCTIVEATPEQLLNNTIDHILLYNDLHKEGYNMIVDHLTKELKFIASKN